MEDAMKRLGLLLLALALVACGGMFEEGSAIGEGGGGGGSGGGGGGASYPVCEPGSAPTLFPNALCICEDLQDIGAILVMKGPTQDPPTFGINGKTRLASHLGAEGGVVAYGGLDAMANVDVRDSFVSNGNVSFAGRLKVGKDLMVGGSLHGLGMLEVGGTLGVSGAQTLLGGKFVGSLGSYSPPGGPPCACGPGQILDVKAEVAKAKAQNDNGVVQLPPSPVDVIGVAKLVLNSGRYYFATKRSVGYTNIVVNGAVKIYIDDNLDAVGYDRFKITEGSSLDLYVAGNVHTVGHMVYGEKHHPAAFRLYIGGSEQATLQVGNQVFRGTVYAPRAKLAYVGRTRIEGSLLAKSLDSVGLLELFYARPTTGDSGEKCTPPGGSPPPDNPDAPDPKDLPDIENM
jgi:hypothetical protein